MKDLRFVIGLLGLAAPSWALQSSAPTRRAVLGGLAGVALSPVAQKPAYAAVGLKEYTDARYGVKFGIPEGWTASQTELPDGRLIVTATDPSDVDFNVFCTFTPIRPDYSSLGSFGTIDYVAGTIIPQCNGATCSFENGDAIEGRMVSQQVVKGNYAYDYTIQQKGGPLRHLRSVIGIKADGGSSLLVGLGAQCLGPRYDAESATLKAIMDSFKI